MNGRQPPFIYMAPLKGITDSLFRRVYCRHFPGLDAAIAPFINPHGAGHLSDKLLSDLLVPESCGLPIVPQLLNNEPGSFLELANRLFELGYTEVNWNLGCPVPMVAKKRRGSGLLPFPAQIIELLDAVMPLLKPRLSIKMRLGLKDYQESLHLLPHLEQYPLTEIIMHPRLGSQLYRGSTAPEWFARCAAVTGHTLVYNGDITDVSTFEELAARFPGVERWMIGRGLLANPLLPSEIKGQRFSEQTRRALLAAFHDDLFEAMQQRLSGPGHLLGRMKQLWIYLIGSFPGQQKLLKKVTKAATPERYLEAVRAIFDG